MNSTRQPSYAACQRKSDGVGNQRTNFANAAGTTVGYTYDHIGQLTNAASTVGTEDRKYVYDAAWNLTNSTSNTTATAYKVDVKNELTNEGTHITFRYDGNGNLTNKTASATASTQRGRFSLLTVDV